MAVISLYRLSKNKHGHTTTAAGMIHGRYSQDIFPNKYALVIITTK